MPAAEPAAPGPRPGLGRGFRRLFGASATSNLSDGVLQAALPLLAASLTRDPVAVATVSALAFVPWLLFSLPAGTLVDRVDRRAAMAAANIGRAAALGLLAAAVVAGVATLPVLGAAAFVLGCAETVHDNAARALLPAVVERHQLERGNSLLATAESVGNQFAGAPVGAWLFAAAASLPLWSGAGGYAVAALLVLGVAVRRPAAPARATDAGATTAARPTLRAATAEGLRWLLHHRLLRSLMVLTSVQAMCHSLVQGVLVLYALEAVGLGERGFGVMLAAGGIGAVVGALASPYVTRTLGRTHAMGVTGVLSAAALLAMGLAPHPVVAVAGFATSAAAVSAFNVQVMSVRQALVPEVLFGRVQGAYRTVIWGGIPLGTLGGGALASVAGLPAVFVVSGVGGIAIGAGVWWLLHGHRADIEAGFATP
ncbi:Predicted arabinose efflux permease, MFS family [Nocardioides scoriae]|uniref:Predicted arabinose efflux permease, MFS family n=1 Tax=Nocardioides scoriae TaxID=642780 RepID=A0A1H1WIK8_9ACTN|nr:MFS transporter [Nocardioides scoriae]SDS96935.1 Predicted arabinose efflux permease, MFS family [Nocardioides scoriae]